MVPTLHLGPRTQKLPGETGVTELILPDQVEASQGFQT
jgi:hypothetical protein